MLLITIRCQFCDVCFVILVVKPCFGHKQYVELIVGDKIVSLHSFLST